MGSKSERAAQAVKLFKIWQRFQERNRVVSMSYSSGLSLLELSILIETDLSPGISGIELSRMLYVSPLAISRASVRLENLGSLKKLQSSKDARKKGNQLTAAGRKVLLGIDLEANKILEEMNSELTESESKRLVKLLAKVAAALPIDMARSRPIDHPLRPSIRTLTRALGSLGTSVFDFSSVSTFEWHVLTAVERGEQKTRATDICKRFEAQRNSVSVLIQRLEKKGLMRRIQATTGDLREKALAIQPKGVATLESILENGKRIFTAATANMTDAELHELAHLFGRMVGESSESKEVNLQFVLRPIVNRAGHSHASHSTASHSNRIGVFLDSVLLGELNLRDVSEVTSDEMVSLVKQLLQKGKLH